MMARFLLDTSALIAHSRREPGCLVHRDHHMVSISAHVVEQIDLATESDPL